MDYLFSVTITACIFITLAVSLNLVVGYTGMFSVAHAAFYGIGSYTAALLALRLHMGVAGAIIGGALLAGLVGFLISLPSLRLKGDYLVVGSFGSQVVISGIFLNADAVTNGALGVRNIPPPVLAGLVLDRTGAFVLPAAIMACLAVVVVWRLTSSPFGRVLRAIREDEIVTQAAGKNVVAFKVTAFVTGAIFAAIAGAFYAYYVSYISPDSFTIDTSLSVLIMVILGGSASVLGSVAGAILLVVVPEVLRFVGIPSTLIGPGQQVILGALIILFMFIRREGIIPEGARWPRVKWWPGDHDGAARAS